MCIMSISQGDGKIDFINSKKKKRYHRLGILECILIGVLSGHVIYKMHADIYIYFCRICLVFYSDLWIFIFTFICMILVDTDYYVFSGDMLFHLIY